MRIVSTSLHVKRAVFFGVICDVGIEIGDFIMNAKNCSITTSIVNALIWGCAAVFACKWIGYMLDGLISFSSPFDTSNLIIMSYVAVGGAIISLLVALFNYRSKISLLIQIPMLLFGTGVLWAVCPFLMTY